MRRAAAAHVEVRPKGVIVAHVCVAIQPGAWGGHHWCGSRHLRALVALLRLVCAPNVSLTV